MNINIFQPRKDFCDTCFAFKIKIYLQKSRISTLKRKAVLEMKKNRIK